MSVFEGWRSSSSSTGCVMRRLMVARVVTVAADTISSRLTLRSVIFCDEVGGFSRE